MAQLIRRAAALNKSLPAASFAARGLATASTSSITVETSLPFTGHNIDPPSRSVETSPQELLTFFRDMALMRRMEIAADSLYKAKLIRGFCHLYDGQEAVCVGMEAAINRKDCIITAYRDHCIFLGRGGTLLEAFAELMGRKDGCSKGKGGSMHFYKKEGGFYGGHGIVGAQVPLGCGLAFAQKYSKDESVTFAMYGDGAANQGQLFEALNMAALWDLPAILVCENNHYGMGTAEWRAAKSPAYYKRGDYVPGLKVDGMDALAVKQACKFAKEHALKNGPIILEMDTYRYHGHSMSDPGSTYRTRDEISGVRQERDPIERIRKLVLAHDLATEKELKDTEKEVRKEVDEAIAQAKESPMPDPSELFSNVYAKGLGTESFGADRKEVRTVLP
ncbi:hypothetical protein SASPL_110567 [Salvia splendens]|uniref:Pyruvate dehydrogenase E1 component subunit alpha n=1 Tax=Salvia splendens TaxID=180675 RepID=A0A8X8Y4V5_SALSN|nr:pyruvate dehydrogenase E1 component subunit alpha, mitochondrial-like [Salvia splendens]KAG6426345.1 hypothetical protein SASPL_110567 [Salvia splendens]